MNLLIRNRLDINIELVEFDKSAKEYYKQLREAVGSETGEAMLDALGSIPYLNLATSLADGLIKTFGSNKPDQVWSARPMFAIDALAGAPLLRTGIYVAYENPKHDLAPTDLIYQDHHITRVDSAAILDRNTLVFSIDLRPAPDAVITAYALQLKKMPVEKRTRASDA